MLMLNSEWDTVPPMRTLASGSYVNAKGADILGMKKYHLIINKVTIKGKVSDG